MQKLSGILKSKAFLKKIIFSAYILSSFILALGFLIATPKVTRIVESQSIFFGNEKGDKPKPIVPDVAGAEKEAIPQIKIISSNIIPPEISAKSVLVLDFDSEQFLYQKNADIRVPPASTTKIMTALVSSEYFKPGDILTVPQEALVGGSSMGVVAGERLSFRSLLYGMMLNSGNDAAFTIAANYPGGLPAFVEMMNQKAVELGLTNTHFQNPAGFDDINHFTSAQDMAKIARLAALDSQLARVVSTKQTEVISWDKSNQHDLKNLNKLLFEEGVIGIKTGYTDKAGENLVGLVDRGNRKVLTVLLNSDDRFGETKALIDWVYQNFRWE
jgi:serine-type D-Ala-D-Ala carboxypeptidase (penicillin-binding protein 5/6)